MMVTLSTICMSQRATDAHDNQHRVNQRCTSGNPNRMKRLLRSLHTHHHPKPRFFTPLCLALSTYACSRMLQFACGCPDGQLILETRPTLFITSLDTAIHTEARVGIRATVAFLSSTTTWIYEPSIDLFGTCPLHPSRSGLYSYQHRLPTC